jgi:sugar/nucleoside kinase (ribokinase family)
MLTDPPSADLLVVGGLTIDRFADGPDAPGGSVLHAARACAAAGHSVAIATVVGPEPVARDGLAELRRLAVAVTVTPAERTTAYRHDETDRGRRLWLEARGGDVMLPEHPEDTLRCHAVMFAPVAGEVGATWLGAYADQSTRVASLQGWLRSLDVGSQATPLRLATMDPDVVSALRDFDVLVASREDLLPEAGEPVDQLASLRRAFGDRPLLAVTDGIAGVWLDRAAATRPPPPQHLPIALPVERVAAVGAGDAFAALLVTALAAMPAPGATQVADAAEAAMRGVAELLAARRGS